MFWQSPCSLFSWVRVGTMATKFKSLLTDDKYEITESDAESDAE